MFHICLRVDFSRMLNFSRQWQGMKELQAKINAVKYKKFTTEGCFTAQRSDTFFSGISTDQTMEQSLMKSMSVEIGLLKRSLAEESSIPK